VKGDYNPVGDRYARDDTQDVIIWSGHFIGGLPVSEPASFYRGRRNCSRMDVNLPDMAIEVERIRGLCFDVDGTLSDTDDMFVRRLVDWLMPVRYLFPGKDPHRFARHLVMETETPGNMVLGLFDWLGIDDELYRFGDFIYRLGLGSSPQPFLIISGIKQMLEHLCQHYPLSIVSARGERNTMRFLDQYQLTGYFTCIATAHTCNHTKPFPDPVLWATRQMAVPPEECLMIGDTVVDIKAGRAAGTQTVGVLCGFGQQEELQLAGADLIISETPSIIEYLLKDRLV
jgi:phosphoglycolate phosphatase-like HAD superfamily hydrolase